MRHLKNFISRWFNELIGIPVAFLIFIFSPIVIRWIDPTAGAYDAGVLQSLSVAAVYILCINTAAWIGIRIVFPAIFKYFNSFDFMSNFKELHPWDKLRISLSVYFFYVAAYLVALAAI